MTGQELHRQMLQTMHRFRRFDVSSIFGPLTKGEFFALQIVQGHQNCNGASREGVYVSELAEKLDVSPPAVSRMLRGMEERGLVERVVDKNDRRNTLVTATSEGKQACDATHQVLEQFSGRVVQSMGAAEMQTMLDLLNRLVTVMESEFGKENTNV